MYICYDCDKRFDNPIKFTETHGLDTPRYETYEGCSFCGGMFEEYVATEE